MKMAKVLVEVTPMMNTAPMLSRPSSVSSPNGMTATTSNVGTNRTIGARLKTALSAVSGTVSSFVISFTMSAIGCSSPKGPQRLGPSLDWNRPITRRSNQM